MKTTFLLFLFALTQSATADTNIDRYGVLPKIQQMTISPNGKQVAFRSVTLDSDKVSVVSLESGKPVGGINMSSVKPRAMSFIDDNNLLMTVSAVKSLPGFNGEFEVYTASTYNIKNKKYKQLLVPGKDEVYAAQANLANIVGVSPDGKWVYLPAYSGTPTYAMGKQISPPMSLFKSKIDGNSKVRIHKRGNGNAIDYFVGDDGKVLARETFSESKKKHSIFAFHGKKAVEIFSEETPYRTKSFIGVSLDEKKLFMLDNNKTNNRLAIYTLALTDGKIEGPLYDRDDADIINTITDTQKKLLGVEYSGFNPSYTFFDTDLNQRVQTILSKFPNESVFIEEISPDRKHVLVRVEGSQSSGEYYLYSKGKKTAFITSNRPDIKAESIHPIAPVEFAARDGLKIPTLITVPKTKIDSLKNLPAIMMPHGGPESFDSIRFDYLAQAFAEQGYLVIQPQFRGSIGFGIKHQAAGYGEWGRKALYDLSDALDFFVKQGIVDKQRVCIVGASYGGYSALAGGAFAPDLYKCVVSINGIGNLSDMLNRERNEKGRTSSALAFWEAQILGFGDNVNKETAKLRSPELNASNFKAPVLLIHSEKDQTVHPRQSITMYRALKKEGKNVQKIELKNEDHYLSNGKTRLKAIRSTVDFVKEHL